MSEIAAPEVLAEEKPAAPRETPPTIRKNIAMV